MVLARKVHQGGTYLTEPPGETEPSLRFWTHDGHTPSSSCFHAAMQPLPRLHAEGLGEQFVIGARQRRHHAALTDALRWRPLSTLCVWIHLTNQEIVSTCGVGAWTMGVGHKGRVLPTTFEIPLSLLFSRLRIYTLTPLRMTHCEHPDLSCPNTSCLVHHTPSGTTRLLLTPGTWVPSIVPNCVLRRQYLLTGVCPHWCHTARHPTTHTCPACCRLTSRRG